MPVAEINHSALGKVLVNVRRNTHHISARWKQGLVNVSVPHGTPVERLRDALDGFAPRLLAMRPQVAYRDGQHMEFPYVDVIIRRQMIDPKRILCSARGATIAIEVGLGWDFESAETVRAVSDMMCKGARRLAADLLLPRARQLAARVGRHPIGWTISRGHRVLGRCSSSGVISLSYVLLFLPEELSDYVILHELAHLTEMNHSQRFHALLDEYLGGREAETVKLLKTYRWPVLRN